MEYLILDIETVPIEIEDTYIKDYLMDKKISKEKRSFDPNYSKVIIIGIKEQGKDSTILEGDEKEILTKLWNLLRNRKNILIVTHNGYQFDIPFLIIRSIINKIEIPLSINTNRFRMEN